MKLSYTLNSILPVHNMFLNSYNNRIKDGQEYLKDKTVTILSLARNIESKLEKNLSRIQPFFDEYTLNYSLVFFENDSTDKTKSILDKYSTEYSNFHSICENFNRPHFPSIKHPDRIKALAEYRNKIKNYAQNIKSDFVIVLDMDFDDIRLDGILNSFGWLASDNSISAVSGNSFEYKMGLDSKNPNKRNLWNYDSWAFRHTWWVDFHANPPAPDNSLDPMTWFGLWIPPTGSLPIIVNSAFGGCCIYKSSVFFKEDYGDVDCEHVCFHYSLYANPNINFKLVLNPSQQMLFVP